MPPQFFPLPLTPSITFTLNTAANPNNWGAVGGNLAGATITMTVQNMPAGEHWLQLVNASYLAGNEPAASTWLDPNGGGYWSVDNNVSPGQPFYDVAGGAAPPNFFDEPQGPWNGQSFFYAYLFVADMDANNVITLHDELSWGWREPDVDAAPEPSTLSLDFTGVVSFGLLGYSRRRKLFT